MHFYQLQSLAENEDNQKRGVVSILYAMGHTPDEMSPCQDKNESWEFGRLRAAAPIRLAAAHICYDNPRVRAMISLALVVMGAKNRTRYFSHLGTHVEIHYKMMSYGIPSKALPMDPAGMPRTEAYKSWLPARRAIDAAKKAAEAAIAGENSGTTMEISKDDAFWAATDLLPIAEVDAIDLFAGDDDFSLEDDQLLEDIIMGPSTTKDAVATPDPEPATVALFPPSVTASPATKLVENVSSMANAIASTFSGATNPIGASSAPNVGDSMEPDDEDVVFGKGRRIQELPGNVRYRQIIDSHLQRYNEASKFSKTEIAESIIRLIHESGGRFLKQATGANAAGWEEVDDLTIRKKVAHSFRARRNVLNKRQ